MRPEEAAVHSKPTADRASIVDQSRSGRRDRAPCLAVVVDGLSHGSGGGFRRGPARRPRGRTAVEIDAGPRVGGETERMDNRFRGTVPRRGDILDPAGRLVFDPRLSSRRSLTSGTDLRLGWGIYHQFPAPREYDPVSGNPGLGPQRAQHWVAGPDPRAPGPDDAGGKPTTSPTATSCSTTPASTTPTAAGAGRRGWTCSSSTAASCGPA